jgi:hypothetical protein
MRPLLYVAWTKIARPPVRANVLEDAFEQLVQALDDKNKAASELLTIRLASDNEEIQARLTRACMKIEALGEVIGAAAVEFGWRPLGK